MAGGAEILDEIIARLGSLPKKDRDAIVAEAVEGTKHLKWIPNPGPQSDAYFSEADCLLFGGEPGGGKSQLILGLAFNEHERSFIMRRQYGDLERLIEDAIKIHGSRDGFNGSPPPRLRIGERQLINFRAAQRVGDEQQTMGQGRDLLGIDEATHFAESQIRFLMGWVRTETPGQRCRTVLATNPALTAEGLWVNKMFGPWLDPTYPWPAKPGELRWVISDEEGKDEWVGGPDDTRVVRGKTVRPTSRTYIPSSVRDNPYYANSDYERQLDALPEPYRSILMGGFRTQFKDHDWQVIPTHWVTASQARWTADGGRGEPMSAMAYDPAGGGKDAAELAMRHGGWFANTVTTKGAETADGSVSAATITKHRRDGAPVVIDVGGGYGGAVVMRLDDNEIPHLAFNGATESTGRTKDGQLRFYNKRAEALWKLREALDPDQEGGSPIALPPDPELLADLTAPTYEVRKNGILIEPKDELRKRLGRSTGKGDAVMMCHSEGERAMIRKLHASQRASGQMQSQANSGFGSAVVRSRFQTAAHHGPGQAHSVDRVRISGGGEQG